MMVKIMNIFSVIVFIGVLFTSVIGEKSTPKIVLRNLENEPYKQIGSNVESTTIIYLESLHEKVPEEECECTPFFSCKTYESTEEGGGLIDIRSFGPCGSYLEVCCKDKSMPSTENYISTSSSGTDYYNSNSSEGSDSSEGSNSSNSNGGSDSSEGSDQTKHSNTDGSSSEESSSENCSCENEDNQSDKETHVEHSSKHPSESLSESSSESSYESSSESSYASSSESSYESSSEYSFESSSESSSESSPGYYTEDTKLETGIVDEHKNDHTFHGTHNTHDDHIKSEHKCGKWNKDGVGFRIFNDINSETQFGEFPSMIAIFKEEELIKGEKKLVYLCGGSLIKTDVVLTAAHCVIKVDPKSLVVRAGEWDIKTIKEIYPHQDIYANEIITHPDYKPVALHNDVALIFTETPFTLEENVQTVCLSEAHDRYMGESPCVTIGWGKTVTYNNYTIMKKTATGKISEIGHYEVSILKKVELPIVSNDKCWKALKSTRLGPKFVLHDSFMCAGGVKGNDACRGDGGSPLLCPSADNPDYLVQVGIVSWGISCGVEDIPGVYANVVGFREWIDHELEKHIPVLT